VRTLAAKIALSPTILVTLVVFVGCIVWTVALSFTASATFPEFTFVGFDQYEALFKSSRWIISMRNMMIFGIGFVGGCLILGYLLAIFVDQQVRAEAAFRTIFLYPYALSYIVTGFAWQWFLNPQLGLQKFVQDLGWTDFTFKLLIDRNLAIYTIVAAAIWHGAGLVMAIVLAGLRGIDQDVWKATRVEGIPKWRAYVSVIIPMLGPSLATCILLLSFGVVRNYDLVVAMTNGGPGSATEVPAKFVMDYLFERQNAGMASAGATILILTVVAIGAPIWYLQSWRSRRSSALQKG
jgi:glucose/mannose transport system permease protein